MSTNGMTICENLFGKVRRNLLALFLLNPGRSYFLLELVRLLRTGRGGVQRELLNLLKAGVVRREKVGTKVYFTAVDGSDATCLLKALFVHIVSPVDLLAELVKKTQGMKTVARTPVKIQDSRKILSFFACGEFEEDNLRSEIEKIELLTGSSIDCCFFRGSNIPARISAEGNRLKWLESDSTIFIKGKLTSLVCTEIAEEPKEYDLFSKAGIDW